eukprot:2279682-Prymnesium_polylepis.1
MYLMLFVAVSVHGRNATNTKSGPVQAAGGKRAAEASPAGVKNLLPPGTKKRPLFLSAMWNY